jgi:hypothetical protein
MDKYISYSEKELKNHFRWLNSLYNNMHDYIKMMEQQGAGKRSNLDWESTSKILRRDLNDIKKVLNGFNIVEIKENEKETNT